MSKDQHRRDKIFAAADSIKYGEPLATTSRHLHYVLKWILEEQLKLFYASNVPVVLDKRQIHKHIDDVIYRIADELSRLADRVKRTQALALPVGDVHEKREALEVFGLTNGATFEEVRSAYRDKARRLHPDLNAKDEAATVAMQELNKAFEFLKKGIK